MGRSRIATGGETELMGKRDLRIYALLDTLKESPVLSIKELADRFQVSEMTIRRDIDYLKENRLFYENKASEPAAREHDEYLYSSEQIRNFDKKDRIARFAAGRIEEGDILILDSGTTTGVLSKYIPEHMQLTVLCYNYHILSQLQGNEKLSLIFAGGYFHRNDLMFESVEGIGLIRRTRASKMFVSASGVHEKLGMTCAHNYEVVTKKAALESSLQKILVADSSKFGQVRPGYFAELEEIDEIVTDDGLSREWQELIAEKDIPLHLV